MSKRHKKPPVDLLDYLDTKEREGAQPITVGDRTFVLRSPLSLSDDEFSMLERAEAGGNFDAVELVRVMVDDYDGLCEALAAAGRPGGAAALVMSLLAEDLEALADEQGAPVGESEGSSSS